MTSLENRLFAVGENSNGSPTAVAVWAERGDYLEWGYNPNSGIRPFNPQTGEFFEGKYTLAEVQKRCPHLAP